MKKVKREISLSMQSDRLHFGNIFERKLNVTATARNWNTVERLLELAGSDGPV